jgi:phosphoribosyl-ATP pyrophosphohydrolase
MQSLHILEAFITERRAHPKEGSYTNSLLASGTPKIAQKVGEEAVEVVVAALGQGREEQLYELADLFFHTMVLMNQCGITLDDLNSELMRRHHPQEDTP